jgi:hypothetical protein
MRLLFKLLLWLLFASPLVLALLFWLSLSEQPLVPEQPPLSKQDMLRAQGILKEHQRQLRGHDRPLQLSLGERDLALAGSYLLHRVGEGGLDIRIDEDRLQARASLRIPGFPSRPWLNLQLQLQDREGQPNLVRLQAGAFTIPTFIGRYLLARVLSELDQTDAYRLARDIIDRARLHPGRLELRYHWTPALARRARQALLHESQGARQAYQKALAAQLRDDSPRSLGERLAPLFRLAAKRSANGDPVAENMALLAVLGHWAASRNRLATDLLGEGGLPRLPFRDRLGGRRDLARHFLLSAALAAHTGNALAGLAGVFKEISDANGGSGFSFADLAADRAGARLGALAVASPASARRLQTRLAAGVRETDLLPDTHALTEGLNLKQFQANYGDLDSAAYRDAVTRIDRAIDACRLYRAQAAAR